MEYSLFSTNIVRFFIENFKEEKPEKIVSFGSDFELSDEKMKDVGVIAEIYMLSENINEDEALEKALYYNLKKKG